MKIWIGMLRISVLEQQLKLQQLEKEIEHHLFLRLSNAGLSLAEQDPLLM
jgi:hypothetical protein